MADDELLKLLPAMHAAALRLRAAGLDDEALADRLEIPPESVDPLIRIAEAKLVQLGESPPGTRADP